MAKKQEKTFIGTHERIIISDWPMLSALIEQHGRLIKKQLEVDSDDENASQSPHILSQREIEDAVNGPMQTFFKALISAYAKLSLIRMNLAILEDETFKKNRAKIPEEDQVPANILQNTSLTDIHKIQLDLNELSEAHHQQWEKFQHEWAVYLSRRLNEIELSLSEIESKEFMAAEPMSELQERFVTFNIPLPKVSLDNMDYSKYFALKSDITIHSALSRQHIPNNQAAINKLLNKLKSDFKTIESQEKEINAAQKAAIDQMIANISW